MAVGCAPGFLVGFGGDTGDPVDSLESAAGADGNLFNGIVFNEVMTDNESTVMDEDLAYPDWVELYNGSDQAVALDRLAISDGDDNRWTGGDGSLEPGEHLLLWADGTGGERLPFRLSSEGEALHLELDGVEVDRIDTGPMVADVAWARHPDGEDWGLTIYPSPGWSNGSHPSETTDPRDLFFGEGVIQDFHVQMSEGAWNSLTGYSTQWVEVSLQFQGAYFDRVGLRLKGSGSFDTIDGKAAFKIDMNRYVEGQELRGMKMFTFNNGRHDPTFTHEYITYLLYREFGLPAPRSGWARLFINDEFYGLYVHVESQDNRWLARWYDRSEEGMLWESEGADFGASSYYSFDYEEGPFPPDNTPIDEVNQVLSQLATDEAIEELATCIDMDSFYSYNALEALVCHWDGYQSPHNYRFFHDAGSDLIEWLVTGTDYTWTSQYYDAWSGNGNVLQYCLSNKGFDSRYTERVVEVGEFAIDMDLPELADSLGEFLDPYIEQDVQARSDYTMSQVRSERQSTRQLLEQWPSKMVAQAEARLE